MYVYVTVMQAATKVCLFFFRSVRACLCTLNFVTADETRANISREKFPRDVIVIALVVVVSGGSVAVVNFSLLTYSVCSRFVRIMSYKKSNFSNKPYENENNKNIPDWKNLQTILDSCGGRSSFFLNILLI